MSLAFGSATGYSAEEAILPVDCVIAPSQVVDMSSPVSGVIETIAVKRSEYVTQGQIVATLDAAVEKTSVALAQKRALMESEINAGQVNLSFDAREKRRIDKLYREKAVSYQQKENADREAELSVWELKQARDLHEVRQLELDRSKALLEQKNIRATVSGFVAKIHKFSGEYVEDQPIVQLVNLDPLFVEAIVPMKLFGKITDGMLGQVAPETIGGEKHLAEVVAVDRMGDVASGTFGVRLKLDNPNFAIPGGIKCGLRFLSREEQQKLGSSKSSAIDGAEASSTQVISTVAPARVVGDALVSTDHSSPISSVGPIAGSDLLQKTRQLFEGFSIDFEEEQRSSVVVVGYLVLLAQSQAEIAEPSVDLWLDERKIKDRQRLVSGEYQNRVSLGVFRERRDAEVHAERLAGQGVETEIQPRTRTQQASWITFANESPESLEQLRLALAAMEVEIQQQREEIAAE